MTFKPFMMFGKVLKDTRKIAVVMDVSRSMTKYLPLVTKELDKVAYVRFASVYREFQDLEEFVAELRREFLFGVERIGGRDDDAEA